MSEITPSQTVGPFFAYGLAPSGRCKWDPNGSYRWKETIGDNLVTADVTGDRIRVEGQVIDGDGVAINDAMIEIWQADAQGRYASPRDNRAMPNAKFKGFGRSATDKNGIYSFDTIKPGTVPGPNGKPQAPHIVVCIFSRGMLRQIYTRLYFSDEKANGADQIVKRQIARGHRRWIGLDADRRLELGLGFPEPARIHHEGATEVVVNHRVRGIDPKRGLVLCYRVGLPAGNVGQDEGQLVVGRLLVRPKANRGFEVGRGLRAASRVLQQHRAEVLLPVGGVRADPQRRLEFGDGFGRASRQ